MMHLITRRNPLFHPDNAKNQLKDALKSCTGDDQERFLALKNGLEYYLSGQDLLIIETEKYCKVMKFCDEGFQMKSSKNRRKLFKNADTENILETVTLSAEERTRLASKDLPISRKQRKIILQLLQNIATTFRDEFAHSRGKMIDILLETMVEGDNNSFRYRFTSQLEDEVSADVITLWGKDLAFLTNTEGSSFRFYNLLKKLGANLFLNKEAQRRAAYGAIQQCQWRNTQPITDFVKEMDRLLNRCNSVGLYSSYLDKLQTFIAKVSDKRSENHIIFEAIKVIERFKDQQAPFTAVMNSFSETILVKHHDGIVPVEQSMQQFVGNTEVQQRNQKNNKCWSCDGKWPHEPDNICPGKSHYCNFCNKRGHFEKVCWKKHKNLRPERAQYSPRRKNNNNRADFHTKRLKTNREANTEKEQNLEETMFAGGTEGFDVFAGSTTLPNEMNITRISNINKLAHDSEKKRLNTPLPTHKNST